MNEAGHVVVVEDEAAMRCLLAGHFAREGFRVSMATDGDELDRLLRAETPDLISLDLRLPGEDGMAILRRLRAAEGDRGIIVVSAQDGVLDRVAALDLGADDYLAKPFDERELVARARSVLRRRRAAAARRPDRVRFHGWELDRGSREVRDPNGAHVTLTRGEFDLLLALLDQPDRVLARRDLVKALGHRSSSPTERTVDVMVGRLRRKLEPDPPRPRIIVTQHGVGYVFRSG
ncbi:MAG: response regulator [Pseudomonadota bacterium]